MLDKLRVPWIWSTQSVLGRWGVRKAVDTLTDMKQRCLLRAPADCGQCDCHSRKDVNRGDNVVLILNTVKDMTQPEIMSFVRNTLLVAEKEIEKPVDISYTGLLRQMRDPEVRRGLALTMRVLHVIGSQANKLNHQLTNPCWIHS
jgi:hypothetical protein